MGQYDAHSRRGNKSDFYVTPFPCIEALLDNIEVGELGEILDPCCGTGVIGSVLDKRGIYPVTAYDIVMGKDFLKESRVFDTIIMNPPYSSKDQFILQALDCSVDIYAILPANVINYNKFHKEFLAIPEYMGRYLMTPKFFMTEEETYNPKRGGISAYAWFHWSTNGRNKYESYERYIDLNKYFRSEG